MSSAKWQSSCPGFLMLKPHSVPPWCFLAVCDIVCYTECRGLIYVEWRDMSARSRFNTVKLQCQHLINHFNTLRPRQNGRRFPDDIFKCIFLNENAWISIKISLKFVPRGPINNIQALVQIMAWRRPGDKPLSEPMMISLLTHKCVTQPQWVNIMDHTIPLSYDEDVI